MKKTLAIVLCAVLCVILALPCISAEIPSELPVVKTSSKTKLYKTASTKGGSLTNLKNGAKLEVIGESGSWYRVVVLNYNGFVQKNSCDAVANIESNVIDADVAPIIASKPNSISQKNALATAGSYLSHSSFSYTGLIHQLEYEGYSTEDATFAADNCGADWFQQAELTASSYLSHSSFSYGRLVSQLEYEGFTHDQAVHGVDTVYK